MIATATVPAQGTQMIDRTVSLMRLVATYCPSGARLTDLAEESGLPPVRITAATRSGDTPQSERAAMLRTPPHILVTTPESLYLLLTA